MSVSLELVRSVLSSLDCAVLLPSYDYHGGLIKIVLKRLKIWATPFTICSQRYCWNKTFINEVTDSAVSNISMECGLSCCLWCLPSIISVGGHRQCRWSENQLLQFGWFVDPERASTLVLSMPSSLKCCFNVLKSVSAIAHHPTTKLSSWKSLWCL